MFKLTHILYLALLVLSALALPQPEIGGTVDRKDVGSPRTNAQRLARGLPPLKPNFARGVVLPGGSLNPTRVGARDSLPSGTPSTPFTDKKIKVTRKDNSDLVGYVKKNFINSSSSKRFGITQGTGSALSVSGPGTAAPFDITETNGPDSAHLLFGGVVGPANNNDNLSTGSANYVVLTSSSHTNSGSPPSAAGNSYSSKNSESSIWSYSPSDSTLTAQWVNTDSSLPATTPWYVPGSDSLLLVGDATAFNNAFPGGYAVVFTLV